jgi:hypothetical protein
MMRLLILVIKVVIAYLYCATGQWGHLCWVTACYSEFDLTT